jgi:Tol biopolymer transport system component
MNDQYLLIMPIVLCLLTLLTSFRAQAVDPSIEWKVIKTPHFEVIYDAKQHQLAMQYAGYAEYSFNLLTPIFKEFPEKTVLVIDDSSDQANGYATRLPYPLINARPVLPELSETIGMYGNWGYELILHEYTHILSFEPAHGVVRPLRWIFGSIMSPNLMLPRWWLEGLAVKTETDFSEWGRLRSNSQDAVLRALTEENLLKNEDIARANEAGILEYPFGSRPYLLGSLMWQKMVTEKGNSAIYDLTQRYSSRVPFVFLEGPPMEMFGKGYEDMLPPIISDAQKKAQSQIDAIRKNPHFKSKIITFDGLSSGLPDVSPDEKKLAYVTRGHNWASEIIVINEGKSISSGKDRTGNIQRLSWHPSSKKIIYDKVGADSTRHSIYFDLYERSIDDFKTEKQLTKAQRAQQPAYSLDGQQIVYVQNSPGGTSLAVLNSEGKQPKILYAPPLQHRISHPEFINKDEIIFSERNLKGEELLTVLNIPRNKYRRVLKEFMPAYNPNRTKNGVTFTSEQSGVANIYLANNTLSKANAISNTVTRANHGDVNYGEKKIYMMELTGKGNRVVSNDFWPEMKLKPPKIALANELPIKKEIAESEIDNNMSKNASTYKVKDYYGFKYMLPSYWLPFIYPVTDGVLIEAMTSNSDPLGKHAYSLLLTYNTANSGAGGYLTYLNNQTQLPILMTYSNYEEYLLNSTTPRKNQTAFFGTQTYIYNVSKKWQMLAGWTYSQRDVTTREVIRTGPKLAITYNTTSQKGEEISPESGNAAAVSYTHYYAKEPTNTRLDYEEYGIEWSNYFSRWFPDRHVLYSHLKGLYANYPSSLIAGATTAGAVYQSTIVTGEFLMRGYPTAAFLGPKVGSFNLEYRFPIAKLNRGAGMTPFFAKRLHGRLFVDAIILDGFFFDTQREAYMPTNIQKGYSSVGGELHLETNTFFYLPINFYLGVYYGMDQVASGGGVLPFFGITL